MASNTKTSIKIGLKKAQSSLNKVVNMVEDDHYCIDVMQQNLAVIGLLRSAHKQLMERHLNTCFASAIASNDQDKKQRMIQEILRVTSLYNR